MKCRGYCSKKLSKARRTKGGSAGNGSKFCSNKCAADWADTQVFDDEWCDGCDDWLDPENRDCEHWKDNPDA